MSGVLEFPTNPCDRAIAQEWLYLNMLGIKGEAFAREWSEKLVGSIRKLPEDMDKMRREIAEMKGTQYTGRAG